MGILLSRIRAVNIGVQPSVTLHVFIFLLESAPSWPAWRDRSVTTVSIARGVLLAIILSMVELSITSDSGAASSRTYRVHGQVVAVNVTQAPHMIVVKTPLSKLDEMTVGAKVTAQTRIVRKGKRIALQTIREGESVRLTYVKQRDGVFAQIIHVW
jgi:hypothetical protein